MKVYNIGILLTRQCNQHCYYCDVYKPYENKQIEVDLDYVQYVISLYGDIPLHIEISGGEPGLIINLVDIITSLLSKRNVIKMSLLSNGLCRNKYNIPELFGKKLNYYQEHSMLDIVNTDCLYFEPENEILEDWMEQIIVLTDTTLNSLLNNFDYFESIDFFKPNRYFKSITPKKETLKADIDKLMLFFNKIKQYNTLYLYGEMSQYLPRADTRQLCAQYSYNPFIDIDAKKLRHCSMQVDRSVSYDITSENIQLSLKGKLFSYKSYCSVCYKYSANSPKFAMSAIKNKEYYNLEI